MVGAGDDVGFIRTDRVASSRSMRQAKSSVFRSMVSGGLDSPGPVRQRCPHITGDYCCDPAAPLGRICAVLRAAAAAVEYDVGNMWSLHLAEKPRKWFAGGCHDQVAVIKPALWGPVRRRDAWTHPETV